LERNFKKNIGISPKEFVNILRFQFALEKIKDNQLGKSLQDIAFESGYYDHAHLSNEIKRYTGLSPSQF
jgi:AraC-like DNA-binding protein